jgi:hypothetical protein
VQIHTNAQTEYDKQQQKQKEKVCKKVSRGLIQTLVNHKALGTYLRQ